MQYLGISVVEKVVELDPIVAEDGSEINLRIEIIRRSDEFTCRVLRWESLRVQPSFPLDANRPLAEEADHLVLVEDQNFDISEIRELSLEQAMEKVVAKIKRRIFSD